MVAINQVAAPATIVLGLASQALALPLATTQQVVQSGLLERAIDSELSERDLEARFFKKLIKGAAKVGGALLGFRDLEDGEVEDLVTRSFEEAEMEERDFDELAERDLEARFDEIQERDLEVRLFGKLVKGALKVGKGLLGFRDLEERDYETLDERDIDELVARFYDESELDTRDVSELNQRDLEARFFKKVLGGIARVGKGLLGFRQLAERDIDVDEFVARAFDEDSELDTRDAEELSERDLEVRLFGKLFKGAAKLGKGLLGLREVETRDVEELDSRDVADLVAAFARDDMEEREYEEMEERDFDDELSERDYEAAIEERDLETRFFKKLLKGAAKVGGAILGFRDLEDRDVEDLVTRTLEETEMEVREETEGLSRRALDMFYRDVSERDEDLSERDLVNIAARYFDEADDLE